MRMGSLRQIAFTIALLATVMPAAAQKTVPDTGGGPHGVLPGPNVSTPQAVQHAPNIDSNVQPVPGTWPGSDTVPSTMSEKNAADDKLPLLAFTFKTLTPDERDAIYQAVKSNAPSQRVDAEISIELPHSVELRPLPDEVVAKIPRTKGYAYVVAGNKVLLVQAPTRIVVGVIEQPSAATTTGTGAR
jgi:hypothetical protein